MKQVRAFSPQAQHTELRPAVIMMSETMRPEGHVRFAACERSDHRELAVKPENLGKDEDEHLGSAFVRTFEPGA